MKKDLVIIFGSLIFLMLFLFSINSQAQKKTISSNYKTYTVGNYQIIYANGDIYEGEFKDGMLNGNGKIIRKDGNIFKGEFKDNKLNGHGIYSGKYNNIYGNIFEGEFKDGKLTKLLKIN